MPATSGATQPPENSLNKLDNFGRSPLMIAAERGHAGIVTAMLASEMGADVNTANAEGVTALMLAAQSGNIDAVRALMAAQAIDTRAADSQHATALDHATEHGNVEVMHMLRGRRQKSS